MLREEGPIAHGPNEVGYVLADLHEVVEGRAHENDGWIRSQGALSRELLSERL